MSRFRLIAVAAVVAFSLLGCSSDESTSSSTTAVDTTDAQIVPVKLTTDGCEPRDLTAKAGKITFVVTNEDAAGVIEFYVKGPDGKVIDEVENVSPSLTRELTLTLDAGSYKTVCLGADNEKGTLEVTGE